MDILIVPCRIDGCGRALFRGDLCQSHHYRLRRYGDPLAGGPIRTPGRLKACVATACTARQHAKGLCNKHYLRFKAHGDTAYTWRSVANGQGHLDHNGYRIIRRPSHPNANKDGRLFEHRFVMSEMLGRPMLDSESVHHKNGNRVDNRPENLELWVRYQPFGQRAVDLLAWAKSILHTYASLETNPYFAEALASHGRKRARVVDTGQLSLEGIAV